MLSKATAQLAEEVFEYFDEKDRRAYGHATTKRRKKVQQDPEACLIALLLVIKKELSHSCATLGMTIEQALYEDNLKEAKQKLKETSQEVPQEVS